jgi:hypothetical protein
MPRVWSGSPARTRQGAPGVVAFSEGHITGLSQTQPMWVAKLKAVPADTGESNSSVKTIPSAVFHISVWTGPSTVVRTTA